MIFLEYQLMMNEGNLKDSRYLKDYESQIRKLSLDELYEVLDIIKKDKSPERIDIVNKRIDELKQLDPPDEIIHRKGGLTAEELRNLFLWMIILAIPLLIVVKIIKFLFL